MVANRPLSSRQLVDLPAESGTQEDQLVARMLTIIWATRTGRTLPPVPVSELSREELVIFWDDDQPERPSDAEDQHCGS
jgi:hypothetical protein